MKKTLIGLALAVLVILPLPASAARVSIGSGSSSVAGTGDVATDTIWDAAGDLALGTGSNTAARLPKGTAYQCLKMNAGATTAEWAACSTATDPYVLTAGARGDYALLSDALGALPMWGEFVDSSLGTGVKLVASSDTTANRARKIAMKITYTAAGELGKAQFYMRKVGVAALYGNCVAELYADSSGPSGATLSSSGTVPLGDGVGYEWTPMEFTWTTAYATTASTSYWLAVSCGDYGGYNNANAYVELAWVDSSVAGAFPQTALGGSGSAFGLANTGGTEQATEAAELSGAAAGTWGALGAADAARGPVMFRVGPSPRVIKVAGRIVDSYIEKANNFGAAGSIKRHAWLTIDCSGAAEIISDSSITYAGPWSDSIWGFLGGTNFFIRNCNFTSKTDSASGVLGIEGCYDCGLISNRVVGPESGLFIGNTTDYGSNIVAINNKVTTNYLGIAYGNHSTGTSGFLTTDIKVLNNDVTIISGDMSGNTGVLDDSAGIYLNAPITNPSYITIAGNVVHADVGSAAKSFYGIKLPAGWGDVSGANKNRIVVSNNVINVRARKSATANGIFDGWDAAIGTGEVTNNTITLVSMDAAASSVGNCFAVTNAGLTLDTANNRCRVADFATNRAWNQTAASTSTSRNDSLTPATYNIAAGTLDRSPACSAATAVDGTTPDAFAVPGATTTHACRFASATAACNLTTPVVTGGVLGLTPSAGSVSVEYGSGCTAGGNKTVTVCCGKE